MPLTFAPNNNEYSKFLFTGRSQDIDTLLKEITSGNCVALYGERRSGKTLTLQMMKEIINNKITDDGKIISSQLSQLRLVDQNLLQTISIWRVSLLSYNAILVSLHGKRTEVELFESIVNELAEIPIDISEKSLVSPLTKDNTINGLRSLLEQLQSYLIKKKEKLVVLMDEMETLSKFRKGVAIAEEFCKTTEYTEIIFIHTGSYTWREHVYEHGSLFNHLEPYFLTSIDERDMRRFLLQPLTRKEQKDFVVKMSGCKPLYAQYIGEILYKSGKETTQYDLLDNRSLRQKVKQNIFEEQALDKTSKLLLSTLSHYQDVSEEWLTGKLKIDQSLIRAKLYNLVDFGTISVLEKKYKICGSFIELCGRDTYTNPIQEQTYEKRLTSLLKWSLMPIFLTGAFLLHHYVHPGNFQKRFSIPDHITLEIDHPKILEDNEEGSIKIFVTNTSQSKIDSLKITFNSEQIKYSKDGTNTLHLSALEPGSTYSQTLNFHVLSLGGKEKLESKIIYLGKNFFFEIEHRPFSIKAFGSSLSVFLAFLGFTFPGRGWIELLSKVQGILLSQDSKSVDKDN